MTDSSAHCAWGKERDLSSALLFKGLLQAENVNQGGDIFVKSNPNLNVRVVHGNTLTAGCIINEIRDGVKTVFLTGATSKLGRAISLYLARKKIKVTRLHKQGWWWWWWWWWW